MEDKVDDEDDLIVLPPLPKKVFELVDVDSFDGEEEGAPIPGSFTFNSVCLTDLTTINPYY